MSIDCRLDEIVDGFRDEGPRTERRGELVATRERATVAWSPAEVGAAGLLPPPPPPPVHWWNGLPLDMV